MEQLDLNWNFNSAQNRAEATLLSFLTPKQQRSYKHHHFFRVTGSHGTQYRITTYSHVGNVFWYDSNRRMGELCAHSSFDYRDRQMPTADHHLAQFLSLVTDELDWLTRAHLMNGQYPPMWWRTRSRREMEQYAIVEHYKRGYRSRPTWMCPCGCEAWSNDA